jgi:hypothetical protein
MDKEKTVNRPIGCRFLFATVVTVLASLSVQAEEPLKINVVLKAVTNKLTSSTIPTSNNPQMIAITPNGRTPYSWPAAEPPFMMPRATCSMLIPGRGDRLGSIERDGRRTLVRAGSHLEQIAQ